MITPDASSSTDAFVIVGENGEAYKLLQRYQDNGINYLVLGRADGAQVTLPHSELIQKDHGRWLLSDAVRDARGLVIPVVEETLEVSRERVETGRVRISKSVESREEVVDEPLNREKIRVEHVPINQVVSGDIPQIREEGDVTVIPILEERVVTRTELVLVEEVRVHRERSEYRDPQRITLRKEVVAVERFGEDGKILPQ
ncbi:MAG: YsnF/AvaK domain-containing protein [Cyanobium sp.]